MFFLIGFQNSKKTSIKKTFFVRKYEKMYVFVDNPILTTCRPSFYEILRKKRGSLRFYVVFLKVSYRGVQNIRTKYQNIRTKYYIENLVDTDFIGYVGYVGHVGDVFWRFSTFFDVFDRLRRSRRLRIIELYWS